MFYEFYTVVDAESGYDSPGALPEIGFLCLVHLCYFVHRFATCVRSNDLIHADCLSPVSRHAGAQLCLEMTCTSQSTQEKHPKSVADRLQVIGWGISQARRCGA